MPRVKGLKMYDEGFATNGTQSEVLSRKGIVLKAPLILNVNCAKILAKKFDFIACIKSIKKELSNDV